MLEGLPGPRHATALGRRPGFPPTGTPVLVRQAAGRPGTRKARPQERAWSNRKEEAMTRCGSRTPRRGVAERSVAQQRRAPGEAATEGLEQHQLAALHLARTHRLVQRQRHRTRRGVAM